MQRFGAVSWDYRRTPEEFQNRLGLSGQEWNRLLSDMNAEANVLLSTCNRVELYFTYDPEKTGTESLLSGLPGLMLDEDAINHLFRVSSGLESMSVGENEILSQVKNAYDQSVKSGTADKLTSLVFRKAISVGKSVREKTSISRGKTSIPVIAVDLASRHVHMESSRICILGTGQMAETFLKYLVKNEPRTITIVGRDMEHARNLAERYSCKYAGLKDLQEILKSSEVLFAATSSKSILVNAEMLSAAPACRTVVDISNPRNIDPDVEALPGVEAYSLDDILSISIVNSSLKKEEIPKAEEIVQGEFSKFRKKLDQYGAEDLLNRSHTYAESIAMMEINRMLSEINKGMDPAEAKKKSASAMANRILSKYTQALKEAALRGDTELISKLESIFR